MLKNLLLFSIALFCVAVALFLSGLHFYFTWAYEPISDQVSSIWLNIARDLTEGVFYRPVLDENGTGGTRYNPLFFILIALIHYIFPSDIILSGQLATATSIVLTIIFLFLMLRQQGLSVLVSLFALSLLLICVSFSDAVVGIKADLLALGLILGGIYNTQRFVETGKGINFFAIFCFLLLAFLAKITAVYAVGVVCLYLLFSYQIKNAFALGFIYVAGLILSVIAINYFSHGNYLEAVSLGADGGATLKSAIWGFYQFFGYMYKQSMETFILSGLGLAVVFHQWHNKEIRLPILFFVVSFITTFVMFASPGIHRNHYIDINVSAIWLIFSWAQIESKYIRQFIIVFFAFCLFVVSLRFAPALRYLSNPPESQETVAQQVWDYLGDPNKPVFFQQSNTLMLLDEKVFTLDFFMFTLMRNNPKYEDVMLRKVQNNEFAALVFRTFVLEEETVPGKINSDLAFFDDALLEAIYQNYPNQHIIGEQIIFTP